MQTSVVIPVWNGARFLPTCLDSLLAQQPTQAGEALEVIVVDNASGDNSADLVAQRYPQVRLIRNTQNQGFAGGCNRGIEAAQGALLVLLNQDTQVQPGWLTALTRAASAPLNGVVGCKILYLDGKTLQHAGGWIDWPLGLSHHHGQGELDQGQWDQSRPVEFVTGAALAVRRAVLDKVGLLDEAFWPGYFEDADFCLRVKAAGYAIDYCADAVVFHQETSSWTDAQAVSSAYQRGRLRFILKQTPPDRLLTRFIPAERAYQPAAIRGQESAALQTAYATVLAAVPSVIATSWPTETTKLAQIIQAFQELYQNAWREEQAKLAEMMAGVMIGWPQAAQLVDAGHGFAPNLTDIRFQSNAPIIGPLLTGLRRIGYSIAARWGIQHLRQQQEIINQQQALQIAFLRRQVDSLTAQNGMLASQLAQLQQEIRRISRKPSGE